MLRINFLFILRKSVNFSVILFPNRKMNSTSVDNAMSHKENWKTEKAYIFGKVTEEPFIK